MADDEGITNELGRTFDVAAMGYLARAGAGADDWAKAQEISRRSQEQVDALNNAYHREYSERVSSTQRQLLEGSLHRRVEHPAPRGMGAGRAKNINEDAKRLVGLAHDADLARVRETTRREMNVLLERALTRSQTPSVAGDSFTRASEGSASVKPRSPKHSQD